MNDMKLQFFGSEKFSIIMTIDFNQNFQKDEIRQQIFFQTNASIARMNLENE